MKRCGIYCFENTINGKKYIGQSLDVDNRYYMHVSLLRNNKSHSSHLQAAWNKYGEDVFDWYVLELCEPEQLNKREKFYIKKFKTFSNGYNLTTGGDSDYKSKEESGRKRRTISYHRKYLLNLIKVFDNICLTMWRCTIFEMMNMEILTTEQIEIIEKFKKRMNDYPDYDLSSFKITIDKRRYIIT